MAYETPIPTSGDWQRTIQYRVNLIGQDISAFVNYTLVLFYADGTEIVRMSKNVVTGDASYKQWLFANTEVTGRFDMKCRKEIVELFKGHSRIYGIFAYQVADANYAGSVFTPVTKHIEFGTTQKGYTVGNLAT